MPKVDDIKDGSLMPRKKFFRSRAHCNPLSSNDSFQYEITPDLQPWHEMFPRYFDSKNSDSNSNSNSDSSSSDGGDSNSTKKRIRFEQKLVRHLDIGMGFGGLTVALATIFPDELVLGMEIRSKVCEYVKLRIDALRHDCTSVDPAATAYQNASCLRTNCMRYLPNYFYKAQMQKIFFCFPDPHFKAKNHRRRIVSYALLSEYAYVLAPGGRLYTITDVEELHKWHVAKASSHECFRRIGVDNDPDLMRDDPAVRAMYEETEEGKKVARLGGQKFFAVFERLHDDEIIRSPLDELWS